MTHLKIRDLVEPGAQNQINQTSIVLFLRDKLVLYDPKAIKKVAMVYKHYPELLINSLRYTTNAKRDFCLNVIKQMQENIKAV